LTTILMMAASSIGFAYIIALFFEAINGFHDTAHGAAPMIASGVFGKPIRIYYWWGHLRHFDIGLHEREVRVFRFLGWNRSFKIEPRYLIPVLIMAFTNFLGAYFGGTAVALFIPKIIHFAPVPIRLIIAAMLAAAGWNLYSWWRKMPVSSTHCLIGALTGAGIMAASQTGVGMDELLFAVLGLAAAPFVAYFCAMPLAKVLKLVLARTNTGSAFMQWLLRWLMVLFAAFVGTQHGRGDGQKTMGILLMISAIAAGSKTMPTTVPHWIVFLCASCMALGTLIGARRIITTVGEKLSTKQMTYPDALAATATTAAILYQGANIALPLSTTQTATGSVLGAAAGLHNPKALSWEQLKKLVFGSWSDKPRRLLSFFGFPLPLDKTDSGHVLAATTQTFEEESTMNIDTVKSMLKMWVQTFATTWFVAQLLYALLTWLNIG